MMLMEKFNLEDAIKLSKKVERNTFNMITPSGKFNYQVDKNGKPIKGEYNLLRHFGTLWYLGRCEDNARRAYVMRGLKWADDKYLVKATAPFKGKAYFYKDSIKTGGVALAILAKLALGSHEQIDSLVDFLLSCQKPDGDFIHKLDRSNKDTGFKSEYYTGEILFALASVQAVRPSPRLIAACMKCIDMLISIKYGIKEQSHWMMHALNAMYRVNHNPIYVSCSSAIASDITKNTQYLDRGCTPIGCRVEALVANAKILKQQMPSGDAYMARFNIIENNIVAMLKHQRNGYFLKDGVCQIDYQQHCGDAMREYTLISQFPDRYKI
jgi:hypothetical protein